MEVHFAPETEKRLHELAAQTGRQSADELVQGVMEGYFDELAQAQTMLSNRYDDLVAGRVEPISAERVAAYFREKSRAARSPQPIR